MILLTVFRLLKSGAELRSYLSHDTEELFILQNRNLFASCFCFVKLLVPQVVNDIFF